MSTLWTNFCSSTLLDRLSKLEPVEADKQLAEIWRAFKGSDQHQALEIALKNLSRMHEPVLNAINATDAQRSFACGFQAAAKTLAAIINTAFDYEPDAPAPGKPELTVLEGGRDDDEQKYDDSLDTDPTIL